MRIGDKVLVVEADCDGLIQAFGDDGDGDFWDRAEWDQQKKYVGKTGTVEQIERTRHLGRYAVVRFEDGRSFTFQDHDLEVLSE